MKKLPLLCILAVIISMFFSASSLFHRKANLMPEEALDDDTEEILDDDTEETDRSVVKSQIQEDLDIFLSSPQGSALLAAVEQDMDSLPGLYFPDDEDKSLNEIRFDGWTEEDFFNNDYLRASAGIWMHGYKARKWTKQRPILQCLNPTESV